MSSWHLPYIIGPNILDKETTRLMIAYTACPQDIRLATVHVPQPQSIHTRYRLYPPATVQIGHNSPTTTHQPRGSGRDALASIY